MTAHAGQRVQSVVWCCFSRAGGAVYLIVNTSQREYTITHERSCHKPPSQPVTTSFAVRHQLKCSGSILSMQYFNTKSSGAPDAWLNAQGQNGFSESKSQARGRHRGAAKLLGCPACVRSSGREPLAPLAGHGAPPEQRAGHGQ